MMKSTMFHRTALSIAREGHHPVYGPDVLLYIGQTTTRFYDELRRGHNLPYHESCGCDTANLKIYIGRLVGKKPESDDKWHDEIRIAEKLRLMKVCGK